MSEMQKFRDMLDEKGIPWHDASEWDIVRTHADDGSFSVICGPYTYGGPSGLLEIMSNKIKKMHENGEYYDDVIGCLTAEEVFEYIDENKTSVKYVVIFDEMDYFYGHFKKVLYPYYFSTVDEAKQFAEDYNSQHGTFAEITKLDKWTGKEEGE